MSAIFVGNLPWTTTSEDLQAKYGPFNCQSAEVVIGKNGRSRGYGIVTFGSEGDANSAIENTNGNDMGGREIVVRVDRGKTEPTNNNNNEDYNFTGTSLYVSNLPWATTGEDLAQLFQGAVNAMVQMDKKGRSRGWGTIKFGTADEATNAMNNLNGTQIDGRAISIRVDRRT